MLNNIVDNLEQCRQQLKHCSMLFSSDQNRLFIFCDVVILYSPNCILVGGDWGSLVSTLFPGADWIF